MNWKHWLKGLIGAIVGGAATAGTMAIVDPAKFNFHEGMASVGKLVFVAGFISMCAYLKQSPVPPDNDPPASASLKLTAWLLLSSLAVGAGGCQTAPDVVAYRAEGVTINTVDTAMKAWADYVKGGNAVSQVQIDWVHQAYDHYYAAQKVARDALIAYEHSKDATQQTAYVTAINEVAAASSDIIGLINSIIKKGQ